MAMKGIHSRIFRKKVLNFVSIIMCSFFRLITPLLDKCNSLLTFV